MMYIYDSWQVRRTRMPVSHLERKVRLSRFFIKILFVEGMAVLVRLAVSLTPSVVPVRGVERFLPFDVTNFGVNERFRLVERATGIDFHLLHGRLLTLVHGVVAPG